MKLAILILTLQASQAGDSFVDQLRRLQVDRPQAIPEAKPAPPAAPESAPAPAAPEIKLRISRPAVSAPVEVLPRVLFLTQPGCIPCLQMEGENEAAFASGRIEKVDTTRVDYQRRFGIAPSMILQTPTLVVWDGETVHAMTPQGFGCFLRGYHTKSQVDKYLDEHGVPAAAPAAAEVVVAEFEGVDPSPAAAAAALAAALSPDDVVGAGVSFDVAVPKTFTDLGRQLLQTRRVDFPAAGLLLEWGGASRTITITDTGLQISPPARASLRKFGFSLSTDLTGASWPEDFSEVTVHLKNAPDVRVRFRK